MIRRRKETRPRRVSALARLELLETRQLLATFTVMDASDSDAGSLRAAILSANAATGSSTINFDIPGTGVQTIVLKSPLPALINPVTINATTQPGYAAAGTPQVEIEGASILDTSTSPPTPIPNVTGLTLTGGSSTVEGLIVDRFTGTGIVATRDSNTIVSNFIGTDPTGTVAEGNGAYGVALSGRNNVIGGSEQINLGTPDPLNVISGNSAAGIYLGNSGSALPTNNIVEGNLIGTDVNGTVDLGNAGAGVDIESSNNTIGGYGSSLANTIAFNGGAGVQVGNSPYLSNVIDNRIEGNSIFKNVNLGIDLGGDGVTNNAPGYNYGPNLRQPFPVLTSAYPSGTGTMVEGSLVASPNTSYTVDFYANTQPDRSGYGQGQRPIFIKNFMTNPSGYVDVTSMLTNSVPVGQYISATATDPNGNTSEFDFSEVVTPTAESDLSVTATNSAPTAQAGSAQTYTYTVQNNGPSVATNVTFDDMLPSGATLVSGTFGQQALPSPVNGVISADIGTLSDGGSTVVTLTFTLPNAGTVTNNVGVMADQKDLYPLNNSLAQPIQVNPAPPVDLSLYGVANPYPVQVGNMLTYTFIVTNNSSNPGTGVLFSDQLPSGVSFESVTSSQGVSEVVGNDVMVDLETLPADSNASVTLVVNPLVPGSLSNFAMVGGAQTDPNVVNNSTTVYSYVTPAPAVDVGVVISSAPVPAVVGQPFLYVITVGNAGSAPATGVTLSDVLPTAALITSIKPSEGTYTLTGDDLTVNFGALPIGDIEEVTVALTPGAAGFIVNRASVTSDQPDFNVANNFAAVATPVAAQVIAPAVLQQNLVVSGNTITHVVLTFNEDMDPTSASNVANYQVLDLGSNGSLSATGPKVAITSAKYNAVTRSVTLSFKTSLKIGRFYKIVANGPGAPGLVDTNGNVLDGENNGLQNSIYESLIARGTTTRPVPLQVGVTKPQPTPKPPAKHHK
jgi:uncharacterized repeat protein (TIGR01451 family)